MIRIRNLWKRYGSREVLKGLSLDVSQGEIFVILGRSGVGKSVLLRHILGLETPDAGSIQIGRIDLTSCSEEDKLSLTKNMGMLFQGSALFDSMTVGDNTAFYLTQHPNPLTQSPFSKGEIQDRVDKALDMVGLSGTKNLLPSDLSGGMRKRAALSRLIVYRPSILLYDEPTTGLDPMTSQQITDLIIATQQELQGTSIVVTHDLQSAIAMADRLALHDEGRLVHVANPEQFFEIDHPIISFFKSISKRSLVS